MNNEELQIEEMKIRTKEEMEKLEHYAEKGLLFDDLIEQFKIRLSVDEGLLDEEVKSLLTEAKNEIIKIRFDMNTLIDENLEYLKYNQIMARQLYVRTELEKIEDAKAKLKINKLLLSSDNSIKNLSLEQIQNIIKEVIENG